jgi:hypothetical protein
MKLFENEKGVSEIVGAMLILFILVLYLGILQTDEVPRWNKELEKQQFDIVYGDFLNLRSNLEDASIKNIQRTMSMHTGVRYPERFLVRNPGYGAIGTINTYPLKINISYKKDSNIYYLNYTSVGIVYEMKGLSDFPKLVYEHGILIKEFGNWNYSDDINHLTSEDGISIPVVNDFEPISSIEVKTINILPIPQYMTTETFSSMNVSLETRFPQLWANLPNGSRPSGSTLSVENNTIHIDNIYGFDLRRLSFPNTTLSSPNRLYSGLISFVDTSMVENNKCTPPGQIFTERNQGCIDIPTSTSITQFIIKDTILVANSNDAYLLFRVKDYLNNIWDIKILFDSDGNGNPTSATVYQIEPAGACGSSLVGGQIDLTPCYQAVSIGTPNVLNIESIDSDILRTRFLIY